MTLRDFILEASTGDKVTHMNLVKFYDYVYGWGNSIWQQRKQGDNEDLIDTDIAGAGPSYSQPDLTLEQKKYAVPTTDFGGSSA